MHPIGYYDVQGDKKGIKYKNTSQAVCANKIMFLRKGPGCELIGAAC